MTATSRLTGGITALLVLLSIGLFGSVGWLAALILAVIAGGLLGGLLHWLTGQGSAPIHDDAWAPSRPDPGSAPVAAPVMAVPQPSDRPRALPEAGRGILASEPDALTRIKGVGLKMEQALHGAGVTRFAQIAAWDDAQIDTISDRIGRSAALIRSEDWVGQARAFVGAGA